MRLKEEKDFILGNSKYLNEENNNKNSENTDFYTINCLQLPKKWCGPDAVFCVTLYNEPLSDLKKTLSSLNNSIKYQNADVKKPEKNIVIALIADGLDRIDKNLLEWLTCNQLLYISNDGKPLAGWHLQRNSLQGGYIHDGKPENWVSVYCIICLKPVNKGKLHSHALFFNDLCRQIKPQFVFQMDVGTSIDKKTLKNCFEHLEQHPSTGAIASCITVEAADVNSEFLHFWQFIDMTMQCLTWPAEEFFGHLSVIPGQFCVFRWQALSDATVHEQNSSALKEYFRGLAPKNLFEQLLYLTEDRVIGNYLTCNLVKPWKICYLPDARATTDACETLGLLLKQRRRWENGALAGRLAFLYCLPRFLQRSDRTFTEKARMLVAALWQCLLVFFSLTGTAIAISFLILLIIDINRLIVAQNWTGLLSISGCMLLIGLTSTSCIQRHFASVPVMMSAIRDASTWLLLIGWLLVAKDSFSIACLFLPGLLTIFSLIFFYPQQVSVYLRRAPEYLINGLLLKITMSTYTIFKLGDISWGTKGLTQGTTQRHAIIFLLQGGWFATTIGLTLWGFSHSGLLISELNPLLELGLLFSLLTLLGAVGFYFGLHSIPCLRKKICSNKSLSKHKN